MKCIHCSKQGTLKIELDEPWGKTTYYTCLKHYKVNLRGENVK